MNEVIQLNTASYEIESQKDPRWNVSGVCPVYGEEVPKEIFDRLQMISDILGDMPNDLFIAWKRQ